MTLSVVASAAVKTHNYAQMDGAEVTAIGNFDTRVGSGVIDLERMIENTSYFRLSNDNKQSQYTRARQDVYWTANQEIQIGLAWVVYIGLNSAGTQVDEIYNTAYHLRLYDPDGTLVASSTLANCNVQLIRYTAPTSGNYQITVFQSGSQAEEIDWDYLAVTYNCE